MVVYRFEDKKPKIGKGTYISQSAEVIGNIIIGKQCYIGPGAKIRGDYGKIVVGNKTSIEENCILHARPNETCKVGDMVTVGHGSILHNCTVKNYAIIGMGAIISDYAVVGVWSVVGEGCVVKNNQVIQNQKIVVGVPAKIVGEVSDEYRKLWTNYKNIYVELAKKYHVKLQAV
jgi:carbonic anhydrase/acetyltransferase-like protein (isoleucine patch superfamily)